MTEPTSRVAGKYFLYPDLTGQRMGEGGTRLKGLRKQSRPGAPLVTVITVCFNSAKTIEQCILSVLSQTYSNIEYIVVDAASSDGTAKLLWDYSDRIDYFVSEPDRGLYHAMNKGVELAAGEYILMLNSDDWYAATALEELIRAKAYAGTHMVSALAQYVDESGTPVEIMKHLPFDANTRLRMPLRHETMLIPAALYDSVGLYNESFRIIADLDLTIRLFNSGFSNYEIPRPLLFFRNTGVSSIEREKLFLERERLLAQQFPFLKDSELTTFARLASLTAEGLRQSAVAHSESSDWIETLQAYDHARRNFPQGKAKWSGPSAAEWLAIHRQGKRPVVSVILPVYNAASTLAKCIESVLAQTFVDIELICINDATPDKSQAIIEEYLGRDHRVRTLLNDVNLGLGATRNRGIGAARGTYIFHIDPDDVIPIDAIEKLLAHASTHDCDLVKGAFLHEQTLFGNSAGVQARRRGLIANGRVIAHTTLRETPELLRSTEGHWSFLYSAALARRVPYPRDLKMGQDSIFLVAALVESKRVGVIADVVYHYRTNPESAMNTFGFRKFMDAIEWRRRAWHILKDAGMQSVGDRLLQVYWSDAFFQNLAATLTHDQALELFARLRKAMVEAGVKESPTGQASPLLQALFPLILGGKDAQAIALLTETTQPTVPKKLGTATSLRIATFVSRDTGGAATGTRRRVAALRQQGADAQIHSLVVSSGLSHVNRVVPQLSDVDNNDMGAVWDVVRQRAVKPVLNLPGYCASELFSLPESVVDFRNIRDVFDNADVVHMHWVMGMFDYDNAGKVLADKPVMWTLADMNAFTGGCHYSEGCEEFKRECRNCPLLGGDSDLAHQAWLRKKAAFSQLKQLHIICPSRWMADLARSSSLLGDKPIHYIPNAFPTDVFSPTNKIVARLELGLPLDKRLLLFGAENLTNRRKGGPQLKELLERMQRAGRLRDVEIVTFGRNQLQLPVRTHDLGQIADDTFLALAYSAVDGFLFPSSEDNAPLTVGEAMLCGTPVIAFPVGNVPDLIQHRQTGYLAKYMDFEDFACGIEWLFSASPEEALQRSLMCRINARSMHDPVKAACHHIHLYQTLLKQKL